MRGLERSHQKRSPERGLAIQAGPTPAPDKERLLLPMARSQGLPQAEVR